MTSDVADHRERLQVDFRAHDGRPEAEHTTAFEPFHGVRENQEIAIAGVAIGRAVAVGMLMRDVVPDADVDRGGDR